MQSWIDSVKSDYAIYNFDLYYHGKSIRANTPLSTKQWKLAFGAFLTREQINHFSIAAFSLGGRFALATYDTFSDRVESMILVAPDGIFQNIWFRIATSKPGNPLFKYLMLHPTKFNRLLHLIEKFGLASSQIVRFAQKELAARDNRKRVYQSWTYFKPLQPNLKSIIKTANTLHTPFHFILGSKDYIVPISNIKPKMTRMHTAKFYILPLKHHQLIEGAKTLIPSLLEGDIL